MLLLNSFNPKGTIQVITLNSPPVNALGTAMRQQLQESMNRAIADDNIKAIVIASSSVMFCAGADIGEFSSDAVYGEPCLPVLFDMIEASPKPVVAAINGDAFGGALEMALACHYRIALDGARLGLPEVTLGLVPGAGGTQRLPRLAGVKVALDMIVSGTPIPAEQAFKAGFVDKLCASREEFPAEVIRYVEGLLLENAPLRRCADISVAMDQIPADFFADVRRSIAPGTNGLFSPERCIEAVEAACHLGLAEGLKREQSLFLECMASPQARALLHLFFAERAATRIPGVGPKTAPREIKKVAIIGAGTMGGGIAMNFANAGIPVTILELQDAPLAHGIALIRKNYDFSVKKGKLTPEQLEKRMALIGATLDYGELADADLVIEAVFEDMAIKRQIFRKLDEVCKPGAILASNTSTLNLDEIAASTGRPQDVIGLHFFSPANVMRLLEIVRGKKTADDVIVSALKLARKIKKTPVVVGVCFGFVGNRMLEPFAREALRLVLEGATPEQVDRVLTEFGFAMGILAVSDLAGNDIGYAVRAARRQEIAHDPSYQILGDKLCELGRYGQKTGRGFYLYQGRVRENDPELVELAEKTAAQLGIPRRNISDQEILERCLYMLINEGAQIVAEGIAYRSGDCDLAWVHGYGFPVFRGGPMQYADEIGLDRVLDGINNYRRQLGAYGDTWFRPAPLLVKLVQEGKKFSDSR